MNHPAPFAPVQDALSGVHACQAALACMLGVMVVANRRDFSAEALATLLTYTVSRTDSLPLRNMYTLIAEMLAVIHVELDQSSHAGCRTT